MTLKRTTLHRGFWIAGVAVLTLATVVFAAAGDLSIPWFSTDGGGGTSTGEGYTLSGTIGQPDAGPMMRSDTYTVVGGFWSGGPAPLEQHRIYLPVVVR